MMEWAQVPDINSFPEVDLSPLFDEDDGIYPVVICREEMEALHFIAAMNLQYPKCGEVSWSYPNTRWDDNNQGGKGYRLVRHRNLIQHCSAEWYEAEAKSRPKWKLFYFEDLVQDDIDESDKSFDFLLGV